MLLWSVWLCLRFQEFGVKYGWKVEEKLACCIYHPLHGYFLHSCKNTTASKTPTQQHHYCQLQGCIITCQPTSTPPLSCHQQMFVIHHLKPPSTTIIFPKPVCISISIPPPHPYQLPPFQNIPPPPVHIIFITL